MRAWKDLPAEILELIFGIIADDGVDSIVIYTLTECQLTCKNWSEHAQRNVYRSVSVQESGQFEELVETLILSESNPGRHLKEFKVTEGHWEDVVLEVKLFEQLLQECPNIEIIDSAIPLDDYPCEDYEVIQNAYERGMCNRLKVIPIVEKPPDVGIISNYCHTAYCLRNNLEKLLLDQEFEGGPNSSVDSLLGHLKDYPKVRDLTIRSEFVGWRNTSQDTAVDVQSMTLWPTVKRLSLYHVIVSTKLLEYIMHAFPNIDHLTMEAVYDEPDYDTITTNISNVLWIQFLVHMHHKIKNGGRLSNLFINDIPGVLTEYFDTTKSYKKLVIVYCDIGFGDKVEIQSYTTSPEFVVTAQFLMVQDGIELPYVQLLRGTRGFLKSLELEFAMFSDAAPLNISSFLDLICQQCPSLSELTLSSMATISRYRLEPQTNTSITRLTMKNCLLSPDIFPELSIRLPSLSYLALQDCRCGDSDGRLREDCHNYTIEMPDTSFDTLSWDISDADEDCTSINLTVETSTKTYYYYCTGKKSISESSSISFQKKSWNDLTAFSLYIQCQDIKNLKLKLDYHQWEIDFTEL